MIIGTGIDLIEIARFNHWHRFKDQQLQKIFSADEIAYARRAKNAERFAARFAAKEAFWKALTMTIDKPISLPFFRFCQLVSVQKKDSGAPELIVDWQMLCQQLPLKQKPNRIHLSISHHKTSAIALVILEA